MTITAGRILGAWILLSIIFGTSTAFSCGPFFLEARFTEVASDEIIRGNVGVIHASYKSYYLVPAYRYLEGLGMSPKEQQAMLSGDGGEADSGGENWFNKWAALRNTIIKTGKPLQERSYYWDGIHRYEVKEGHDAYLNCHADAFQSAFNTLNDRIQKFGKDSAEVAEWTRGQDTVFSNCSRGHHIPGPADKGMNKLIQYDRDYQVAAAHFYAGDFIQAGELFGKIAQERSSPWSGLANYLAARAFVREATVNAESRTVNIKAMARAEAILQSIVKDKTLAQYHAPAMDLFGYAKAMSNPVDYIHEIALSLTQKEPGKDIFKYWREFSYMLRKADAKTRDTAKGKDDITDWVLTVQDQGPQSLEHALGKWRATSKVSWLVAAISKIGLEHPDMPSLMSAAGKIKSGSPAYPAAQYHVIRLLVESGKSNDTRKKLDSLYANKKTGFSPADGNLLGALRFRISHDMEEFVKYAQRTPVCIGDNMQGCTESRQSEDASKYAKRKYVDEDGATVINEYMPLALLRKLSENKALAEETRRDVAAAVFARAVIIGNDTVANDTVPLLSRFYPEAKKLLSDLAAAKSDEERHFLSAYLMLQYPAMKPYVTSNIGRDLPDNKIDNYRRNWWCSLKKGRAPLEYSPVDPGVRSGTKPSGKRKNRYPLFLKKDDIEQTERELKDLMKTASGPVYLIDAVVKWATTNSGDPRIPHALHLAVRSSRYGCTDQDTTGYSKQAFKLLHGRYPNNKWAKQTPYYY